MKLRLFGTGPVEDFPYLVIAADVTEAMWKAQKAHSAWFDEPQSVERKRDYAWRLLDWGKLAHKKDAVELAERYLQETGGV
jgi:hypothetical protein